MSRLVVLMYHRVAPDAAGPLAHLTVPPDRFAWQMARLRDDGFSPQTQENVRAWLAGRRALPRKAVAVTLDDGYADNVTHAFPVLERLRIPAVTFIVTGKLGGMNDWDGDDAPWPLMDAGAVRDWSRRGLEFGAHSRSHRTLVGLDEPTLREEIAGSGDDLARLTGREPLAFAYPFGHFDVRARQIASERFAISYSVRPGANGDDADPHLLRRTAVLPAYPNFEFLCQLRLGWGPRARARFYARRLWRRAA